MTAPRFARCWMKGSGSGSACSRRSRRPSPVGSSRGAARTQRNRPSTSFEGHRSSRTHSRSWSLGSCTCTREAIIRWPLATWSSRATAQGSARIRGWPQRAVVRAGGFDPRRASAGDAREAPVGGRRARVRRRRHGDPRGGAGGGRLRHPQRTGPGGPRRARRGSGGRGGTLRGSGEVRRTTADRRRGRGESTPVHRALARNRAARAPLRTRSGLARARGVGRSDPGLTVRRPRPAQDMDPGGPRSDTGAGAVTEPIRHSSTRTRVLAVHDGVRSERTDSLATEEPLEIRVQGPEQEPVQVAVTMRTPGGDFELAVGFLFTEGLIAPGDVQRVAYCDNLPGEHQRHNVVYVTLGQPFDAERLRRNFYATSSCGVCGKAALDDIDVRCEPVAPGPEVELGVLISLPDRLREWHA